MANKTDIKFEDALKRLEEIVKLLDGGNISLEESLEIYEEGISLAGVCAKRLDEAEQKVKKIALSASGAYEAQEFEPQK